MPTVKDLSNTLKQVNQFSKVDADYLINVAREEGQQLTKDDLKHHQIRRFFEAIKGIERSARGQTSTATDLLDDTVKAELIFLKPHLINAAKKQLGKDDKGLAFWKFATSLETCINPEYFKIHKDLNRFIRFFEAVVAYHS